MRNITNGIVIAGTHSGCGKTTITLGILAALRKKGLSVQSFKAGPDFIDAGLHKLITGRASRNLDLWMCGEEYVRECFQHHSEDADISVVEGVMGLYDGKHSTASLAQVLGIPVILVVDTYGMAESAGAVVRGFREYSSEVQKSKSAKEQKPKRLDENKFLDGTSAPLDFCTCFAGVIFNRVASENHFSRLKDSVHDVPVLGYLLREIDFEIPHRHLGLTTAEENPVSEEAVQKLADTVLKCVDVDSITQGSGVKGHVSKVNKNERDQSLVPCPLPLAPTMRIAVAYDRAFCFYYEDNLDMLRERGAEIQFFSPLSDRRIPDGVDALYIGGGYPELYAEQLSGNESMLRAIKGWSDAGRPLYAECGGFMYLTEGIWKTAGEQRHLVKMAGIFPFETEMKNTRARLGYREIHLQDDCILGRKGDTARGHEFHYSEITQSAKGQKSRSAEAVAEQVYSVEDGAGKYMFDEGYRVKNTLGSYIHIHFGSNQSIADNFMQSCKGALWK